MTRLGTGFAYGFVNEIWRAYWFDHDARLSHGRPVRDPGRRDHSTPGPHEEARASRRQDQNTDGRIIWPGSIFIDPKGRRAQVADHRLPRGRQGDQSPRSRPTEMDPALTQDIMALAVRGEIAPDKDVISAAIINHLTTAPRNPGPRTATRRRGPGDRVLAGLEASATSAGNKRAGGPRGQEWPKASKASRTPARNRAPGSRAKALSMKASTLDRVRARPG